MKKYLILLVGFNPLPNYISALNNIDKNTEIYLVYTKDNEENLGTETIAYNLKKLLEKKFDDLKINIIDIDKSNPIAIDECIDNKILNDIRNNNEVWDEYRVILDYTGSTKILASKFYCKVKEFENSSNIEKVKVAYSYVDAASGEIKIKEGTQIKQSHKKIQLEVDEILELHGFFIYENNEDKIFVKDNKNEVIELNELRVNELSLECTFKIEKPCKIGEVKLNLFRNRDYSVKIGGEQAITILKTNLKETDRIKLKKDFDSTVLNYVKDRVKIELL